MGAITYSGLYDMHIHSLHSFDSVQSVDGICMAAVEKGLGGVAITDHIDMGHYLTSDWRERLAASVWDAKAASSRYGGRLDVLCGVEAGQPLHDTQKYDFVLKSQNLDVVIMSLHNTEGREDYALMDYSGIDAESLLEEYAVELFMMVRGCDFDILAHIGYPLRYIPKEAGGCRPPAVWEEGSDAVLRELAGRGKALEVNMSRVIRGGGEATAGTAHLRRFKELGGEYVTIGSDAHMANHVGGCFEDALELLRVAGFRYAAHYKEREPVLRRI